MLELDDIYKELNGKEVLKGVSFRVPAGETLVIVGASGAGKSVMLQHIAGLMAPDSGTISIDGVDLCTAHGRQLEEVRNRFGMLFQSGALINWMSVRDNIALPLYEKTSLSDEEIRRIVAEKLDLVGLQGAEDKMPAEISGGMRKRAGLARAIVRDPALVLYDEPTSGLDPVMSRTIDRLILALQRDLGVTAVVVTHDLRSAFAVGNNVAMLHQGELVELSPPEQFRNSRCRVVREFVEAQFGEDEDRSSKTKAPSMQGSSDHE